MKTNKTKKRKSGFTLVELIVVIAILAILAAVAIPVYSGYIKKANEAADLAQLDSIKTAATFAYTENVIKNMTSADDVDVEVSSIKYVSGTKVWVNGEADENKLDISAYTDGITFKSDTYKNGATWSSEDNLWTGIAAPAGGGEG